MYAGAEALPRVAGLQGLREAGVYTRGDRVIARQYLAARDRAAEAVRALGGTRYEDAAPVGGHCSGCPVPRQEGVRRCRACGTALGRTARRQAYCSACAAEARRAAAAERKRRQRAARAAC